jgi:threonine/homoserine/homoserine lactone efflux protein
MLQATIAGILLGLALVFAVGPVLFTILKLRINYGMGMAFAFISGVWLSDLLWIFTANFFSDLLGQLVFYEKTIRLLGGLFLLILGLYYLFIKKYNSREDMDAGIRIPSTQYLRLFLTGFFINTLNPGVIALWFAAASKSHTHPVNERILLFSLCFSINLLADIFKINLAGKLKARLTEQTISVINIISGLLYLVFGATLIAGLFIP